MATKTGAVIGPTSLTIGVPDSVGKVTLSGIGEGWKISCPLVVTVEQDDDGEYVVSDDISTVYGNGATSKEAIADYCEALIAYHAVLEKNKEVNAATRSAFAAIGKIIQRI